MCRLICTFVVSMTFKQVFSWCCSIEPQHNKTNKMTCVPSEDSDQPGRPPSRISLPWVHEETLGPKLLIECTAKTLIRQGGCPGWSAPLLGAQVILLVFSWCGSIINCIEESWCHIPGPLARSDACPPGNQTFMGSIPGPAHSFVEIWSWNYFYGHSLPTTDSSRAVVSCWRNRMCT